MSGGRANAQAGQGAPRREGLGGARLTIDVGAILANHKTLAEQAAPAACAAVVKADAYGLGAMPVAPNLALEGARHFFVATLGEALRLHWVLDEFAAEAAPDCLIYVLNGPAPSAEADFAEHGLIPVLNSLTQVDAWRAEAKRREAALPAILHADTGMARLGLQPDEVARLDAAALEGIALRYVMSHLACAEDADNPMNAAQRKAFEAMRAAFPGVPASFANSAGIYRGTDYCYDLVRPGCALYGVNPAPGGPSPMKAVVRLTAPIIQTRTIDTPQTVGYGATWRAEKPTRVATIALGYADGYPRYLSGKGRCYIEGHRVPVIGRVSMDLITLDVSQVPETLTRPGTEVEILGPNQDVDAFAEIAETIGYEVLTNLGTGARIERDYVGSRI